MWLSQLHGMLEQLKFCADFSKKIIFNAYGFKDKQNKRTIEN